MSNRSFRRAHARRVEREHRRFASIKRRTLVAGATLGASAVLASSAQAATTFVVDTKGDGPANASACDATTHHCPTLRDALAAAGDGDTITFDSSLSGDTSVPITLTNGSLGVAHSIAINGPGAGSLAVSGNNNDRVFYVDDPAGSAGVSISGLTIENGYQDGEGGAVYNEYNAPLTLNNDTVKDSKTTFNGGGIYTKGPITISGTTVTGNTSTSSGIGNGGGGIAGTGDLTITDSQITGNHVTGTFGTGGGILVQSSEKLSLTGSTVSGNDAKFGGDGISDKYGNAAIEGSTISGNMIPGNPSGIGGGVLIGETSSFGSQGTFGPVTIDKTTISGNQANTGAGVDISRTTSAVPITISSSTLNDNQAHAQGTQKSSGGGLQVNGPAAAPIEVIDSTLSGNTADHGAGVGVGAGNNGTTGPFDTTNGNTGSLTFDNTTIDSNQAYSQDGGGGIYLANYYPTVDQPRTAPVALNSTVVAGNSASGSGNDLSRNSGDASSVPGGFNANYSLIQNPDSNTLLAGGQADITGVDAQLGALANNGGPTQTMLPADSSPVIDQGKAASGLTSDQRGQPRTVDRGKSKPPGGDGTDIGSVELAKIVPPPSSPPPSTPQISVIVNPATGITALHATLNGKVNTSGLAVSWYFQWGPTKSYGKVTPHKSISAGNGTVPVSFQVTGLSPGCIYHYRVVGVSSAGQTATSSDASFKTSPPTINVSPAVVFAGNKVRVFGLAGGCPPGDSATLISDAFSHSHEFAGHPAIHARVQAGDSYSVVTTIPAGRAPGRYAITARSAGGNFGVTAHLRVLKKHVRSVRVIRFTG